jgi:agmatine/peptidylarginine deiminase
MSVIAQWGRQDFIALILPTNSTDWNEYLDDILDCYYSLAKIISKYQKVLIIYDDKSLISVLENIKNIDFINASYNDTWARDILPISIKKDNKIVLLNFIFNAWGGKYDSSLDNELSKRVFSKMIDVDICLEGGGIDNNGDNLMLINKQTFDFHRNNMSFEDIVARLENIFDVNVLVLSEGGICGDDTNSHIDTLARFINKDTIFYQSCEDKNHINYDSLLKMKEQLKQIANTNNLNLVALPSPSMKYYNNTILPATYINFIIINGAVIVPTYDDDNDDVVLDIFRKYFVNRDIIGFDASVFIRQNGSLHCASTNFFK